MKSKCLTRSVGKKERKSELTNERKEWKAENIKERRK
tara:strand:+ start:105 stop:215 length:111 start_codon:yes stop_codon:yes gene_type:complete